METDREFDLHVWIKEDGAVTISKGKRAICVDYPPEEACDLIREEIVS